MEERVAVLRHHCCRCGERAVVGMRVRKTGVHWWFCVKHYRMQLAVEEPEVVLAEQKRRA